MIEINLVPDVKQELIKAQRARATVITSSILISIASATVVTLLAVYVFVVQTARGSINDGDINRLSTELSGVEDLSKTLTIQNQLSKIYNLNDQKVLSSRLFGMLNAVIPPSPNDIKLSNLTLDTEQNLIIIEGQADNSYAAVEVFKKTIEAAKIRYVDVDEQKQEVVMASNVTTSDTSYGEDSSGSRVLRFTISFTYVPELFAATARDAEIVIATTGNVTDSHLGVPNSLFVNRANDVRGGQ